MCNTNTCRIVKNKITRNYGVQIGVEQDNNKNVIVWSDNAIIFPTLEMAIECKKSLENNTAENWEPVDIKEK